MFGGLGTWEIFLVFLVVLLVFGARRIPEIAQGLGKGIQEFRKAAKDIQNDVDITKSIEEDKTTTKKDQHPAG